MPRRTLLVVTVAALFVSPVLAPPFSAASAPSPPWVERVTEDGTIAHDILPRDVPATSPATAPVVSLDGIWSALSIAGRSGQAAALDPLHHRMIIFGGRNHLGSRADLWELTLDPPTRWRRLTPAGGPPPPMDRMSLVLDPERDRLLLYGGRDSTARDSCEHSTCRTFGGVWALDLKPRLRWTELSTLGPAPAPRSGHVAIYDPRRGRMLVFGGERVPNGACPCGTVAEPLHDAWALVLHGRPHWEAVATRGAPPTRSARGSAFYDPVLDRMVYVPGGDTLFSLSLGHDPTWSAQATQSFYTRGTGSLEGRTRAVYDAAHDALYQFSEMTIFRLALHGDLIWTPFVRNPPWFSPLISRSYDLEDFSLLFDPRASSLILFGGATSNLALPIREADAVSTTQPTPAWSSLGSSAPLGLGSRQLVFDPGHQREIVVGARYLTDMRVWSLDPERDTGWSEITSELQPLAPQPQPREQHGLIVDAAHDRLVMFGGRLAAQVGVGCPEGCPPPLGDVWAFGLEDHSGWYPISPSEAGPSPRAAPVTIYDRERDRMLVVGGLSMYDHARVDSLWMLSLSGTPRWTGLPIRGQGPRYAYSPMAALDSRRKRMLIESGWPEPELWSLDLRDPPRWEDLGPTTLPPQVFLYDPGRDRLLDIVQGALAPSVGGMDVWVRDLASGTEGRASTAVSPDGDWPPARFRFTAAFDPVNQRVVMYGGYTGVAHGTSVSVTDFLTDTWFLDLERSEHRHPEERAAGCDGLLRGEAPRALAIQRAQFDAAVAVLRVTLSLPDEALARIALYDLAGRRVAAEDVRLSSNASHEVGLPLDAASRTGVYFIRVSQGGRVTTARVIVIH